MPLVEIYQRLLYYIQINEIAKCLSKPIHYYICIFFRREIPLKSILKI